MAPNPLVGCVIVHDGQVIAEGFHEAFGGPHAEVNAIASVQDESLLSASTLYVNLEPCAHHGKTPPCADLIISKKIPRVVIGVEDPYAEIAGRGILKLREAGVKVVVNVSREECEFANRRFFTQILKQRPYIILKWAQTKDGFMDRIRNDGENGINWITGPASKRLVHNWRSKEAAILIGKNTALNDDPNLTVREVPGRNPIRILLDRKLEVPRTSNLYNREARTIVFCDAPHEPVDSVEFVSIDFERSVPEQIMFHLNALRIQSVMIEGGPTTLKHFLKLDLWDEARVFTGDTIFGAGIAAPVLEIPYASQAAAGKDLISFYNNR